MNRKYGDLEILSEEIDEDYEPTHDGDFSPVILRRDRIRRIPGNGPIEGLKIFSHR